MTLDEDKVIDFNLPELKKRERPFENRLRDALKTHGILFIKTKPTRKGFPDRLAIAFGKTQLVEIKRDKDAELSETQALMHKTLRNHGVRVLVVHGPDVEEAAYRIEQRLMGYT